MAYTVNVMRTEYGQSYPRRDIFLTRSRLIKFNEFVNYQSKLSIEDSWKKMYQLKYPLGLVHTRNKSTHSKPRKLASGRGT